jgi:hypothetical protein
MKNLALRLSAVALLAIPVGTARADLVLSTLTLQSGQGFGATTTILTVSAGNAGNEQGCFAFGGVAGAYSNGDPSNILTTPNSGNLCTENGANDLDNPLGPPKNQIVSLGSLGITNTSQIGLVLNLNEVNNTGMTINDMNLSFYTATGDVIFNASLPDNWCTLAATGSAAAAALCSGANTFLASIPGQGGNGYVFVLNAAQQAGLAAAIGATSFNSIFVGAGANFGCTATAGLDCKVATTGAESIQLAQLTGGTSVVTPEPSTTALMATGLLGLFGVVRRRRRQG